MEFALERHSRLAVCSHSANSRVAERLLDRGLAVVEVTAHPEHGHVRSVLGDHLFALDVRDALGRVEDDHLRVLTVCEAVEGSLAGVAARGHEDEEVVRDLAALLPALHGLREEQGHALERNVFERARGAVPQL